MAGACVAIRHSILVVVKSPPMKATLMPASPLVGKNSAVWQHLQWCDACPTDTLADHAGHLGSHHDATAHGASLRAINPRDRTGAGSHRLTTATRCDLCH